ncbi:MAG: translation initiation factor [Dehalococcoidia bacterium]
MPDKNSRLVYSTDGTDGGRIKPPAEPRRPRPAPKAAARPSGPSDPDDGFVRIRREKGGRGGKTVTTVTGLPGSEADLDAMVKTLKQLCGAGGTREGRAVVIQGDHRDRIQARLEALGHRVKLAGG